MPDTISAADELPYSPGIVSVLPFLYIAWADGLLTPTQVAQINARVSAQNWLSPDERDRVAAWLDPAHPPDATTYYRWVRLIKASAHEIPSAAQKSLAELGVDMATLAGVDGPTDEARRALVEIEDALGVVGREAVRELVGERPTLADPSGPSVALDVERLQAVLDGRLAPLRDRVRTLLCEPVFR